MMKYVVRYLLPLFAGCVVLSGCEFWDPSGDSGEMVVGVLDALDVADVADGVDSADATPDAAQDVPDPGDSQTVDVVPSIVGTWNIESSFDLTSDLPPTVDSVLEILFKLFTEPADQLLAIMCDETILGLNQGNNLCASLFTDPENPDPAAYTEIGTFVAAMIDANALEMRKAGCPYASPDACSDVYYTFADVGLPLQKFGTRSTMTCTVEPRISVDKPDAGAVISLGDCSEEWMSVVFRWTLGMDCDPTDEECGNMYFSLGSIPGFEDVIAADISGAVIDGRYLRIDRHPVGLKYGALVNFAMQYVVIPGLFGGVTDEQPAVDSYEDLIGALLGSRDCLMSATCCADFESAVLARYPDLPAGVASDACASVRETAIGYMRDQINAVDEYGRFSVGTPDDAPAPLIDNDDDMVFDTIGNDAERCIWDARFALGTYEYEVDADFMGIRNQ